MIAPSLYADFELRGVALSVAPTPKERDAPELPPLRLRVRDSKGALTPALHAALVAHRDALVEYVFDLEERAAILEHEQGNARGDAELFARACVVGGSAGPDGRLWLRDLAERHPATIAMLEKLAPLGVKLVSVQPMARREEAA